MKVISHRALYGRTQDGASFIAYHLISPTPERFVSLTLIGIGHLWRQGLVPYVRPAIWCPQHVTTTVVFSLKRAANSIPFCGLLLCGRGVPTGFCFYFRFYLCKDLRGRARFTELAIVNCPAPVILVSFSIFRKFNWLRV